MSILKYNISSFINPILNILLDSHKVTWTVPFCFIASIILSIVKFFASSKTVSSSRCRMFVRSLQSSKTTISGCTVWMTVATSTWNKIIQKIIYVNAKLNWGNNYESMWYRILNIYLWFVGKMCCSNYVYTATIFGSQKSTSFWQVLYIL